LSDQEFNPDDIRQVKVEEIPNTGTEPEKEKADLTDPMAPLKAEKGWFGHIFGARSEKSGNIAGLLVMIALVFMGCAYFAPAKPVLPNESAILPKDFLSALVSLVTLALGYLFGRNSRSD
jgi:hypothetical protein